MIVGTVLFAAAVASGIGTLYLLGYLFQYRDEQSARWFMLALSGQAIFCLAYSAGLLVTDRLLRQALEVVALVGLNWVGVPFLGFALAYTGRTKITRSWSFRGLFVFPLAATVLLPLNGVHGLLWSDFDVVEMAGLAVATYTFQPLFFVVLFGGSLVSGIGALLLFDTVWSYGPLYRTEAFAVAVSPIPPAVGLFVWLFEIGPLVGFNWTVPLFLPHLVFDAYAFVGSGMFDFNPSTNRAAERSALDDLPQPVFVLDGAGRVVEINPPAAEIFDLDERSVVTQQVSAVVDAPIDESADGERITVETGGRVYEFRVDATRLTDSGDNHVGYLLFFQDVTEEIRREERLAVLNRVLRHNLRNELSIAQGYISVAEESVADEQGIDSLDRAHTALDELLETSEQARTIEKTLGDGVTDRRTVDLEELLAAECDAVAGAATVSLSCPSLQIRTEPAVLGTVVGELLDNAVEHNDADDPTVSVSVDADDGLRITVEDNGPGIADHEREALDRGDETALGHGSGLGLWLTKWGTNRLGGEVAFEATDEGTRVVLTFPPAIVVEDQPTQAGATEPARADGSGS